MKKIQLIFTIGFFASFLSLVGCTFHTTYINRKSDNKDGKLFLREFYNKIAAKEYTGIDTLDSDSLKKLESDGTYKMVKFISGKLGKFKAYEITDCYIICTVTDGVNDIYYNYKLNVSYDKGKTIELIGMRKHAGSKIKLNSYHANSDLLMQ